MITIPPLMGNIFSYGSFQAKFLNALTILKPMMIASLKREEKLAASMIVPVNPITEEDEQWLREIRKPENSGVWKDCGRKMHKCQSRLTRNFSDNEKVGIKMTEYYTNESAAKLLPSKSLGCKKYPKIGRIDGVFEFRDC